MSKVAWFITHDSYVDRRIFLFIDFYRRMGYNVKLFAAPFFSELTQRDPKYTVRPIQKRVVKRYSVDLQSLDDEIQKLIICVRNEQIIFKEKYGKYAKSLKKLGVLYEGKPKISIVNRDGEYALRIEYPEYIILYNSISNTIIWQENTYEIIDSMLYESKIVDFMNTLDWSTNINGEIWMDFDEKNQMNIHANDKFGRMEYIYCFEENILEKRQCFPYLAISKDDILGHIYDFLPFKEYIYDYTPILAMIKKEMTDFFPSIVYVADLPTLPIGVMLKEITDCRLIVDCHEWWFKQTCLWEENNRKKAIWSDYYEKELYPKCDLRITVGANLKDRMETHLGVDFEYIYSYISKCFTTNKEKNKAFWNEMYDIPIDSHVAIYQGRYTNHRNLENLVKSTCFFSDDAYLVIIGDGETNFRKLLLESGNPSRVLFHDWIPQEELIEYSQNADIGVIPYTAVNDYAECFVPNKLMEYFAAKLPIIYDRSMLELSLIIEKYDVGLGIDMRDPMTLGKGINNLLHQNVMLEKFNANYDKCGDCFGFEKQITDLSEMMERYFEL